MRLREVLRDNMVFTARKLLWVASVLVLLLGIPSFSAEARKLATFGEEVVFSASSHYKNGELTVSEYDRSNPSGPLMATHRTIRHRDQGVLRGRF